MEIHFRVEYEPTPIRHIAVQCPNCEKWFPAWDILKGGLGGLRYEHHIRFAQFDCPVCGNDFGVMPRCLHGGERNREAVIEECGSAAEVYRGTLRKKEVWE